MSGQLLAQYSDTSGGGGAGLGILFFLLIVAFYVFYGYCLGRVFQKAGWPLWAGFVPIYNTYVMIKVAGRPGWWLILYFIPIVNVVVTVIVYLDLAKSFGHGAGFAIGLIFLPFIFIPILGLSDDPYLGPGGSGGPAAGYPPPAGYPVGGGPPWDAPR